MSGARERNEQSRASKRASDPELQSVFLVDLPHCAIFFPYLGIDCQCNVSASSGGLLLRVVDFSTTELNCKHDYVAVHTSRKIEKFCGEYAMGTFYRYTVRGGLFLSLQRFIFPLNL